MKRRFSTAVRAVSILLLAGGEILAAQEPHTTTVQGSVVSPTGLPVAGAVVVLSSPWRMGTVTDERGAFVFTGVTRGNNRVTAHVIGFDPVSRALRVGDNGLSGVELQLGSESGVTATEIGRARQPTAQRLRFSTSVETDQVFGERAGPGANEVETFLNGPLPGGFAFNVGGTMFGLRSPFAGQGRADVPTYVYDRPMNQVEKPVFDPGGQLVSELPGFIQYGGECDAATNLDWTGTPQSCHGQRVPGNWNSTLDFEGRLAWEREGTTISFDRQATLDQSMVTSPFLFQSTGGIRSETSTRALRFRHRSQTESGGSLSFQFDLTRLDDDLVSGRIDPEFTWQFRHFDPPFGIQTSRMPFEISADRFSFDTGPGAVTTLLSDTDWDQLILNTRTNRGTLLPFQDQLGRGRYPLPNWNPFGISSASPVVGTDWGGTIDQRRRNSVRADAVWSPSRIHRLRLGVNHESSRVRRFSSSSYTRSPAPTDDVYTGEPVTTEVFGYYRLAAASALFEVGLVWYKFDSKALFPIVPGRIFTHPDFDPTNPTSPEVWTPAERHTAIAPTVRFSFATPDGRTAFRVSYEEQRSPPDFDQLMAGANRDLANVNTSTRFGSDVGFDKSSQMEGGLRRVFGSSLIIDLSGFRRTRPAHATFLVTQFFDPFTDRYNYHSVLTQMDFGTFSGVSLGIQIRASEAFRADIEYTRQHESEVNIGDPAGVTIAFRPAHDTPDVISAAWTVRFSPGASLALVRNMELHGTVLLRAGTQYTRVANVGSGQLTSDGPGASGFVEPFNSSNLPWTKELNLRLVRRFDAGLAGITLFANVTNLLGSSNVVALFAETGELENEEYFRVKFLEPQTNILRNDAVASGWGVATGGPGTPTNAVDLTGDCDNWYGGGGPTGCMMLRTAEQRFGNGDGIYDFGEFESAIRAWYNWIAGPQTLLGPGRHMSVGVQLDF